MLLRLFCIVMMILSCSPAAKESSSYPIDKLGENDELAVLQATESIWIGGVAGARGKIYAIRVKRLLRQDFKFVALEVADEKLPLSVSLKGDIYTISARSGTANPQIDAGAAPLNFVDLAVNGAILHYTEAQSKKVKQLIISKFVTIENIRKAGEEPVP